MSTEYERNSWIRRLKDFSPDSSGFRFRQWLVVSLLALFAKINRCLQLSVSTRANASVGHWCLFGNGAIALKLPTSMWHTFKSSWLYIALLLAISSISAPATARSFTCNATIDLQQISASYTPSNWGSSCSGLFCNRAKKCKEDIQRKFLNPATWDEPIWDRLNPPLTTAQKQQLCGGSGNFRISYGFDKRKKEWNFTQSVEYFDKPNVGAISPSQIVVHSTDLDYDLSQHNPSGAPAGGTYQWLKKDFSNNWVTLSSPLVGDEGVYSVKYTDPHGCSARSNSELSFFVKGVQAFFQAGDTAHCINGTASNQNYSWQLTVPPSLNVENLNADKVPAGSGSNILADKFRDSINEQFDDNGISHLIAESWENCFYLYKEADDTYPDFNLKVGMANTYPNCTVSDTNSCAYNPTIGKIVFKNDCLIPRENANMIALYPLDNVNHKWKNNPVAVKGKLGNAASFSRSYIEMPHESNLNFGMGDFSIAIWVKTQRQSGTILSKQASSGTRGYMLYLYQGKLALQLADGTGIGSCSENSNASCTNYNSDTFIADGNWHFISISVDRDNVNGGKFYIDGNLAKRFNPTFRSGSLDNNAPLKLASNPANRPSGMFRGELDEVALFKTALSGTAISKLYQANDGICKVGELPPVGNPNGNGDDGKDDSNDQNGIGNDDANNQAARLVNISTRAFTGHSVSNIIGGFAIQGTSACDVMIRGFGRGMGLSPNLDTQLTLYTFPDGQIIQTNDAWQIGNNITNIPTTLYLPDPTDSAIFTRLNAGAYTVAMAPEGMTGTGMVSVDLVSCDANTRFINISTRAEVKTGQDAVIAGFIIQGEGTVELMIRAFGRGLNFDQCLDTQLELYRVRPQPSVLLDSNQRWQSATNANQIPTTVQLPDASDAGILVELGAGAYTAIMTPQGNSCHGIGLIGVDVVPQAIP